MALKLEHLPATEGVPTDGDVARGFYVFTAVNGTQRAGCLRDPTCPRTAAKGGLALSLSKSGSPNTWNATLHARKHDEPESSQGGKKAASAAATGAGAGTLVSRIITITPAEARERVAEWLAMDNIPFIAPESEAFKRMVRVWRGKWRCSLHVCAQLCRHICTH